ncbi:hypothetical protein KC19_9G016500 [Ceratodon purpureus]|uniref:Uncharacterized protein n=1 Tax=Ceratodon purpureus TaxID=3225 RepID=A0A8T0GMQ6_CERPU|nr:hypothetical protein KC19_9G016500 [Ceratodon purpureus]
MTSQMEQIRRMNQSHKRIQHELSVSKCTATVLLLVLFFCAAATVPSNCSKPKFDKIFVVGDSYVDTGNRDPCNTTYVATGRVNQNWATPYGRTHPGVPAGRFSDGKVLSDHLGDYMGLKPCPFRLLNTLSTSTGVQDGINFAVSGSGVFENLGFTKTGDQITQLRRVLKTNLYSKTVYKKAVILYAISGNDYAAYKRNNGSSDIRAITALVLSVVRQVSKDLRELYDMGFRSFVIGKLPPVGCMPVVTVSNNFSSCHEDFNNVATMHNLNLVGLVAAALPEGNVIFLNHQLAFSRVVYNISNPDRLKACCSGVQLGALCGDVNKAGQARFTLCSSNLTRKYFWWDEYHPTEAGWDYIFHLFLQGFPFIYTDGRSLPQFLGVNGSRREDMEPHAEIATTKPWAGGEGRDFQ